MKRREFLITASVAARRRAQTSRRIARMSFLTSTGRAPIIDAESCRFKTPRDLTLCST
jgi:hypothetical protein